MTDLIERAAEAAYLACQKPGSSIPMTPWTELEARMQTHFRTIARAVLDAAEPGLFEVDA